MDILKKGIKQKRGSRACIAAVTAMATRTTIKEFKKFIGHESGDDGYSKRDLMLYLITKGYSVGTSFHNYGSPFKINKTGTLRVEMKPIRAPAYIVVESENYKNGHHALYWDGERVFDPLPDVKDGKPLRSYKITAWSPIYICR